MGPLETVVVVAASVELAFSGGSLVCEPTMFELTDSDGERAEEGERRWVSTTPVARRAPTMPADHAPALDGEAAIQLRRAESASALTGMACSPSSEGCLQRRSSGGRRGEGQLSSLASSKSSADSTTSVRLFQTCSARGVAAFLARLPSQAGRIPWPVCCPRRKATIGSS